MAKILFIIAPKDFRDEELKVPREILKDHQQVIASLTTKTASGMLGMEVKPDIDIHEALKRVNEFDVVIFIGGVGAKAYFDNHAALEIARQAFKAQKLLAAICIAPVILANAGVLAGRKATSHESGAGLVKPRCGEYLGSDVAVDGKLVTANGPAAAKHFAEEILRLLK